jgi:hypothetical protein
VALSRNPCAPSSERSPRACAQGLVFYLQSIPLAASHYAVVRHEALEADAREALQWLGLPPPDGPLPRTHEEYAAHNDTQLDERGTRLLRQHLAPEYAMLRRVLRHATRPGAPLPATTAAPAPGGAIAQQIGMAARATVHRRGKR